MKRKPFTIELSLRPYFGRLYVVSDKATYEAEHRRLFKSEDRIKESSAGRMMRGCGQDNYWTYLVWAKDEPALVHELSHVVLHVFVIADIDPRDAEGEPFCYMIQQLLTDYRAEKREALKAR